MNVFVKNPPLELLVVLSCIAAISGWALVVSINDEDAGSACIWGTTFVVGSLGAAWSFWRLV